MKNLERNSLDSTDPILGGLETRVEANRELKSAVTELSKNPAKNDVKVYSFNQKGNANPELFRKESPHKRTKSSM